MQFTIVAVKTFSPPLSLSPPMFKSYSLMKTTSHVRKRRKPIPEMEVDRLGALPEPLLIDIIRRLGLKEAARTAVLSSHWRFLWTNLPFHFSCRSKDIEEKRRFAAGVHSALALRRGRALETLFVEFDYDQRLASDVDSWLDFAAKNKVKRVDLRLLTDYENFRTTVMYDLPPAIYSNSSLADLSLENCVIASVKTPVEWRCLKSLWLRNVKFRQRQAIGEILSGCPLLETLTLDMYSGFSRLKIGNRSFSSLLVMYCSNPNDDGSLEIWAPYMKYLHIYEIGFTSDGGRKVRFENVGSLESAGFEPILTDFDSANSGGDSQHYRKVPSPRPLPQETLDDRV